MEPVRKEGHEGRIIRKRRIKLGLTQEQVAMELGISLQQYQRYEYGKRRFSNCPIRMVWFFPAFCVNAIQHMFMPLEQQLYIPAAVPVVCYQRPTVGAIL